MRKVIPNTLTSFNAFSGCIATVMAFNGQYGWVVFWTMVAAFFDFSDGFCARLLKAYSPLGKELDSIADVISFGLVPGATVFMLLSANVNMISDNHLVCTYLPFMGFILTVFSALRLAKFNIDTRQSDSFIGLNTPANAVFWVSFCYALSVGYYLTLDSRMVYAIVVGIVLFSALLVSEIPMFAMKITSLKPRGNEFRYLQLVFTIGFIAYFGVLGMALSVLSYIAISLFGSAVTKKTIE